MSDMRKTLLLVFFGIGMTAVGNGADLLVTKPGKYTSDDKKTSLVITSPSSGHLYVQMTFKIKMEVPGVGQNAEVTDSRRVENLPVESGWAYCLSSAGDVWCYDGAGAFTLFRRQADHVDTLKSCADPNLGERSPRVMKQWIAKRIARAGPVNGSQPETNRISSTAGSNRR